MFTDIQTTQREKRAECEYKRHKNCGEVVPVVVNFCS